MTNSSDETVLLRYPDVGEIVRVTDRGYGFVGTPSGDKFIHLYDHSGSKLETMEGLEGKLCAYVIGGSAVRWSEQRPNWDLEVVEWRLLSEVDVLYSTEDYKQRRSEVLAALDLRRLVRVLAAEWYYKRWRKKANSAPQAVLQPDSLLESTLRQRLSASADAEELIWLLGSICNSPWYAVDEKRRASACQQFFTPSVWPWTVFVARAPLSSYRGYDTVGRFCGQAIERYANDVRVIAVDIESDGKNVFEFGWQNARGVGVRRSRGGLSEVELSVAVDECFHGFTEPCLVGHNLLNWDLPILRQHQAPFPEAVSLWDTLLASWLLEPWLGSHALVVEKDAHTADSDAAACYGLFFQQVEHLHDVLRGQAYDIGALVDHLFENPALLSEVPGREYPGDRASALNGATVIPSRHAGDFAWQRNCRLQLVAQESRLADPLLDPGFCRTVAEQGLSLSAKAVTAVVAHARSRGVHVHLSDLPSWLVDDGLKSSLRQAHQGLEADGTDDAVPIYLAEDLFRLSEDEIEHWFAGGALSVEYPSEVALAWQEARYKKLSESDVRGRFPLVAEGWTGRALFAVRGPDGAAAWLLQAPPPAKKTNVASWLLLPAMPAWLPVTPARSGADQGSLAWVPRWRDGDATQLDSDRTFVSPDTANRPLYIQELVQYLLNLLRSQPEDAVIVLGVRWPEEANELQRNLVQLGLSADHPGTPLRQLESIRKKGLRVLVCARDEIPKFIQAAASLGAEIQVALDELPLHDWYAILNDPSSRAPRGGSTSPQGAAPYADEDEAPSKDNTKMGVDLRVALQGNDIPVLVHTFLEEWLRGLGIPAAEAPTCLILDPRVADRHVAKTAQISQRDTAFYEPQELLDPDALLVYYTVCNVKREAQDIPNDYESYRAFLEKTWGYPDFRPNTQKPAIDKLIEEPDRDMLLRLPTGAGKSIIFHLPALFRTTYSGRLTVVITPLRALMRDQVQGLWDKGFTESVDYLSGGRDPWINHEVYQGILDGRVRLVFVAPERFRVPRFVEVLERRRRMDDGLEFVVFDEAHCISEWGFEFRPDYLYAAQYVAEWFKKRELPGNPHRLLLTSATITERNRLDLEKELSLGEQGEYVDLPEDMPHPIQPYIVLESLEAGEDEDAPSDDKFEEICNILGKLDLSKSAALVFVRRRKDCERISEALNARATMPDSDIAAVQALPFHAGLSETVKAESCDLLAAKTVNVLVCTKAFGMGMDIGHLHACVHHRPPTFIEDYLQEVGRIGRDEGERILAGHDRVTATLLYNQDDIERNLSLLHDSAVTPLHLQDLFVYCVENAVLFEAVGKSLCLVPATVHLSETNEFDANRVSSCLFWLERMGVLRIEGRQPQFLNLSVRTNDLSNHAKGGSLSSRVATSLMSFISEGQKAVMGLDVAAPPAEIQPQVETVFGRVTKGLARGILALITPSQDAAPRAQVADPMNAYEGTAIPARVDVSVSMAELMRRCGDISADDLFAGLFTLTKANAVSLHKSFIMKRYSAPSGDVFFALLEAAIERLLRPTDGKVEYLEREQFELELRQRYLKILNDRNRAIGAGGGAADAPQPPQATGEEVDAPDQAQLRSESQEPPRPDLASDDHPGGLPGPGPEAISRLTERLIKREVYRARNTSLRILRYAGLELRDDLSESGVARYVRVVPSPLRNSASASARESVKAMQLFIRFAASVEAASVHPEEGTFEIPLTDVIDALGGDVRVSKIKELVSLIDVAGFFRFEGGQDDWVSLVTLNTHEPLPAHVTDSSENPEIQRVYTEMLQKHELQVLRAQAMVLLAAMPEESRKEYIDSYFECVDADDLTELLERIVGDVDEEVLANSPLLQDLLSQVRRERFSEEMARLNDRQLAVCTAPFDRTLMVNAGPGSGKTHVLMMRCAHLIHLQRVDPAEILVLAFNRAVVHEIRDRVRSLFRALGYGSYANRLAVTTFHSFALRYQQESELYEEDAIGQAVHAFAQKMQTDRKFARDVGGKYKAILVDEFQDMNEDFYGVVKALLANCRGGGMVIGDDDQDILAWNRKEWGKKYNQQCPLDAGHYFADFLKSLTPESHTLTLNYRSVPHIVDRSSGMIEKAAAQVGFSRMKDGVKLEPDRSDDGCVEMPFKKNEYLKLVSDSLEAGESVAILCRSNRECRHVYEELVQGDGIPDDRIEILGSEDFPLYQLRHSGALLDVCRGRKDYDFVEPYIWEEFISEISERNLADWNRGQDDLGLIYELVKAEVGRPRVRDLQSFVEEMRGSDVERLKPKVDVAEKRGKLTLATVHKVKGLQYDSVFIMPSTESFPFTGGDTGRTLIADDAAEEARLYYVAMTRARNRLYGGWDHRENAWWTRSPRKGAGDARFSLKGSPKESYVSWAGQQDQVQDGLQGYIEQQVGVGDTLALQLAGRYKTPELIHQGRCVGRLSKDSIERLKLTPELRVSNVIRYTCGNYFRENQPTYWMKLDDSIKRQGWFYLVLAEEA